MKVFASKKKGKEFIIGCFASW